MKLGPGQSTGEEPEDHKNSDQVLLVMEGKLSAVIDGKRSLMKVIGRRSLSTSIRHPNTTPIRKAKSIITGTRDAIR